MIRLPSSDRIHRLSPAALGCPAMPTPRDAADLARATRDVFDGRGPHRGDWPESVRVEHVDAVLEDDALVVRIRFAHTRCPAERLGTAFVVDEMFWTENDGVLDAAWAATHALIYFGEATWAGGDPCAWDLSEGGVRWYRERLV